MSSLDTLVFNATHFRKPTKDSGRVEKAQYTNAKYIEKLFKEKEQEHPNSENKDDLAGISTLELNQKFDKSGFLVKRGDSVKTWKRRWFEVKVTGNSASLYYYKAKGGKVPSGVIPVCLFSYFYSYSIFDSFLQLLSSHISDSNNTQKPTFFIHTPRRTFVIVAANDNEKKEWMDHLEKIILSFKEQ